MPLFSSRSLPLRCFGASSTASRRALTNTIPLPYAPRLSAPESRC
ncbi:hypothetical protein Thiowin_02868 [Thiorhodovibrio winogradskyi]|uniref:Uncharacterized protein n=1 Tax=Thiorhodovibrio winogradskyi TaxID=77007 RepID=A0ABZ0S9W5_9GAMM